MAGSIPLSVEPDPLGSSLLAVPQCPPVQALESTPAGSTPATCFRTTVAGSVYVPLKAHASAHAVSGSHSQLLFPLLVTLCPHV